MDLDEREVAEDKAERNARGFEGLDSSVGEARVRALVVAEDEERRPRRAAHVVARLGDLRNEGCAHGSSTARQIAASCFVCSSERRSRKRSLMPAMCVGVASATSSKPRSVSRAYI